MSKGNYFIVFGILSLIFLSGVVFASSCLTDYDADDVADCNDNCHFVYNPLQIDSDFDGWGDCCDADYIGVPGYCNTPSVCGDGVCSSTESYLTCPTDCPTPPVCGNGILEVGETCDDGIGNGVVCDNSVSDCFYCSSSCDLIYLSNGSSISGSGSLNTLIIKSSSGWNNNQACEPNWRCSISGDCDNGIAKRNCEDTNHCNLNYNKPSEVVPCEMTLSSLIEKSSDKRFGDWGLGVWIAIFLVLILIVLWILLKL